MNRVGYFSPFVPPEWIAAYGLRPAWLVPNGKAARSHEVAYRGMCPCPAAILAGAVRGGMPDALVLTTACDQVRYAWAQLDRQSDIPCFLLNVPSTWQSSQARELYREELHRLGRFLCGVGGREPGRKELESVIRRYDAQRAPALAARPNMPARDWTATLVRLRSDLLPPTPQAIDARIGSSPSLASRAGEAEEQTGAITKQDGGIPLGLIGGPLIAEDDFFLEVIEQSGGRIVVDGTETGERTLPGSVDRRHLQVDPIDELVRIYFDTIPDVFRRPNTRLYDWLSEQWAAHSIRGVILRRYPFCDLWHAERHRLREWGKVPVLDIDVALGEDGERSRTQGRIEAFLEMLR